MCHYLQNHVERNWISANTSFFNFCWMVEIENHLQKANIVNMPSNALSRKRKQSHLAVESALLINLIFIKLSKRLLHASHSSKTFYCYQFIHGNKIVFWMRSSLCEIYCTRVKLTKTWSQSQNQIIFISSELNFWQILVLEASHTLYFSAYLHHHHQSKRGNGYKRAKLVTWGQGKLLRHTALSC